MEKKKITIFLDRDGIICRDHGYYITRWSQFEFMPHIFDVLWVFKERGYRVIVVTNQTPHYDKEIMDIHDKMRAEIYKNGGRIDNVYFCSHNRGDDCHCRKPKSGMFIEAKKNFPDIDFRNSFMIGDRWEDMDAASALGIKTCMLINRLIDLHKCKVEPDFCISDISQAIRLVPAYFENKELHETKINWIKSENSKSYGIYVNRDESIEKYGKI